MNALFMVLAFLGMYAAGFFSCMLIFFSTMVFYYRRAEKKRRYRERVRENGKNQGNQH